MTSEDHIVENSFSETLSQINEYLGSLEQLPDKSAFKSAVEDDLWRSMTGEYNDGKRSSGWYVGSESFANDNDGAIRKNLLKEIRGQPPSEILEDISVVDLTPYCIWTDSLSQSHRTDQSSELTGRSTG